MDPHSVSVATDFIVELPCPTGTRRGVTVEPIRDDHVECWEKLIQPSIDTSATPRADRGWRWRRIVGATRLTGSLGQQPSAYAVCLPTKNQWGFIPCVMTALVESYPAFDSPHKMGVFLWFLSTADALTLSEQLGDAPPKLLGSAGLDIARTRSFKQRLEGRVGLHADPKGGEALPAWYSQQGMVRLDPDVPRVSPVRRNDGRYFFYGPAEAVAAHVKMDPFRPAAARIA